MSWKMSLLWNVTPGKMSQFQESRNYCWWMFSFLEARGPYTYTLCWAGAHWAMSVALCIPSFSAGKPWLCSTATGWLGQGHTHTGQYLCHCASPPSLCCCWRILCFPQSQMVLWQLVQKVTLLNQCISNGTSEVHNLLNDEPSVLGWNAPTPGKVYGTVWLNFLAI